MRPTRNRRPQKAMTHPGWSHRTQSRQPSNRELVSDTFVSLELFLKLPPMDQLSVGSCQADVRKLNRADAS